MFPISSWLYSVSYYGLLSHVVALFHFDSLHDCYCMHKNSIRLCREPNYGIDISSFCWSCDSVCEFMWGHQNSKREIGPTDEGFFFSCVGHKARDCEHLMDLELMSREILFVFNLTTRSIWLPVLCFDPKFSSNLFGIHSRKMREY